MYVYIYIYVCIIVYTHILIGDLREMDNTSVNVSSSPGDTTLNVRTVAVTSNTESEVPSNDQGIPDTYVKFTHCISTIGCVNYLYLWLRTTGNKDACSRLPANSLKKP